MSKTKISEYSATANSNTDVGGINIDEGCAPSGINDAIRTLMAQLKNFQTGTGGDSFNGPVNGTVGATTPSTGAFTSITASGDITINNGSADGGQLLLASSGYSNWGVDNYSGNFRWYYNTTEKMRLDNAGNLGLGVTPSAWISSAKAIQISSVGSVSANSNSIDVSLNRYVNSSGTSTYISTAAASLYEQYNGGHYWYQAGSGTAGNAITFTQAMTLDASGNLLIGATSPLFSATNRGNITLNGDGAIIVLAKTGTDQGYLFTDGNEIRAATTKAIPLTFYTNNTERARIDSSGNLLVGTTSTTINNGAFGTAVGAGYIQSSRDVNGSDSTCKFFGNAGAFYVQGNGNCLNTNNSYGSLSDAKLKENIVDATPKLAQLNQVRIVNYNLIGDTNKQLGVIAQELEQVFPSMIDESVDRDEEGNDLGTTTKSVKYSVFVPMLIKAMQEQQAIIQTLTSRIEALEQA